MHIFLLNNFSNNRTHALNAFTFFISNDTLKKLFKFLHLKATLIFIESL